jgi:hypothetical protein
MVNIKCQAFTKGVCHRHSFLQLLAAWVGVFTADQQAALLVGVLV